MSQHKTGLSNWTDKQRANYWDRRDKGLRGQVGVVTVHRSVLTKEAGPQKIPLGDKVGSLLSLGKSSNTRAYKREEGRAVVRQQRKGSTRGE
jgi:hypothetical protein